MENKSACGNVAMSKHDDRFRQRKGTKRAADEISAAAVAADAVRGARFRGTAPFRTSPSPAVPNYAAIMRTGADGTPTIGAADFNLLSVHETAQTLSALSVFMEDAVADALTYVAHAGRAGVGAEDIVSALKAQVFACKVGGDCDGDVVVQRETAARLRAKYGEMLATENEARRRAILGLPSEYEEEEEEEEEEVEEK